MKELMRLMQHKLRVHKNKGSWKNEDPAWLLRRLDEEREELGDAFWTWDSDRTTENWQAVEYELADMGNFLMMIIDVGRTQYHPEVRNG